MSGPDDLPRVEVAVSGAPGVVFVRIGCSYAEMTPGQALRHAMEVNAMACAALAAGAAWDVPRPR